MTDINLVSFSKPQIWLPIALSYLFTKSCFVLLTKKIDVVFLGDALLSPLGAILRQIFGKPVVVTCHGLDITWEFLPYQFVIRRCLKRLDKTIGVSRQTAREIMKRGISGERITVINNGIDPDEFVLNGEKGELRKLLSEKLGIDRDLEKKVVMLSVGRLVERKGYHWFIKEAIPRLLPNNKDLIYLIAGNGPLRDKILEIVRENSLESSVLLLGKVENEMLKLLYNASDIFVMPNVRVEGDMEGFGIVSLEASSCGLPVVASEIEGIMDAVSEGTGFLVKPGDAKGFAEVVGRLLGDEELRKERGTAARLYVKEHFSVEKTAKEYLRQFRAVCEKQTRNSAGKYNNRGR